MRLGTAAHADLEHVEQVLPRNLQRAHLVVERAHRHEVAIGQRALVDVRAHAAAVDQRHVAGLAAVRRMVEERVGHEVAQVRLGLSDPPGNAVVFLRAEKHLGGAHFLARDLIELVLQLGHERRDLGIGAVPLLDELGAHPRGGKGHLGLAREGVDDERAEALELGARLGDHDVLAAVVLYLRLHVHLVRMAVDDHVDAVRVGDDLVAAPTVLGAPLPQVAKKHHVIGIAAARGTRLVHGRLHRVVEALSALVAAEAVDIVSVFILKALRHRRRQGGRGGGADERDAHRLARDLAFLHAVGVEHAVSVDVHEVAADVAHARLRRVARDGALGLAQLEELLHAVVELMVSAGHEVVAARLDGLGGRLALGEGADDAALDVVPGVDEKDIVLAVRRLARRDEVPELGVAEAGLLALELAVDVVRAQNRDTGLLLGAFALLRGKLRHELRLLGERARRAGRERDAKARQDRSGAGQKRASCQFGIHRIGPSPCDSLHLG